MTDLGQYLTEKTGLRLSEEALHPDELSKDEASSKDNYSPVDVPNGLGELRFASDD